MGSSVLIQQLETGDFESYYKLVSDERVMAMITGKAMSRPEALRVFDDALTLNKKDPILGKYKVFDSTSGEYIGSAKLELDQAQPDRAELGYVLAPNAWGKGYGTAVALQLVDIARSHIDLTSLYAMIDPENMASRKILLKAGFKSDGRGSYKGLPSEYFSRLLD